jgi:hypothetical protein
VKKSAALGAAIVTMALAQVSRAGAKEPQAESGAAADSEAISLIYEDSPPPDCPSQAEFEAEVVNLTAKARFTQQRGARRVRIELASSGREVVGRSISGDGKNQSSREVKGRDCKEVASALAISVALTIDPDALGLGGTDKPPEPQPPTETKPPEPAAKPAPRQPLPLRPGPPAPLRSPRPEPTRLRWGLGIGLTLENAWAPEMRPGGHVLGLVGMGERFRASLAVTRFLTREVDDVDFGAWMAHGSFSLNLAVTGRVRPYAALGYELGAVDAAGTGLPTSVQAQRPWHAVSVGLGLRFEAKGFFLQLGGSLLVPTSRQRYLVSDTFDRVRTFYEVPRLGLKQETSLGVFL